MTLTQYISIQEDKTNTGSIPAGMGQKNFSLDHPACIASASGY